MITYAIISAWGILAATLIITLIIHAIAAFRAIKKGRGTPVPPTTQNAPQSHTEPENDITIHDVIAISTMNAQAVANATLLQKGYYNPHTH